jgi:hypothetical protein
MTFAILGFNPDRLAAMAMNALAVGGGFLAGYLVMALAAYFLDRWLTGGKSPFGLHKTVRAIGGVCGAVLVALLVFGDGIGTGRGDGPGTTPSTGAGSGTTAVTTLAPDSVTKDKPPEPTRSEEIVRVTVLSGDDVVGERFYVVEGDPAKRTLDEVKRELAARKAGTLKTLAVEVVLAKNTDPQNSGVQSLIGAARDAGFSVKLPPSP